MEDKLQLVLSCLQGVKGGGNQYTAKCPAHDDRQNSLAVSSDNGKVLLNCFAGCETENIVSALGLTMADLFVDDKPQADVSTIYKYYDENGQLAYSKVRKNNPDGTKSFYFEQPNGTYKAPSKRYPYNLTAVLKADTVYFVEGEKCADRVNNTGLVATSLDGGANSKWQK